MGRFNQRPPLSPERIPAPSQRPPGPGTGALTAAEPVVGGELQGALGAVPALPPELELALLHPAVRPGRHAAGVRQVSLAGETAGLKSTAFTASRWQRAQAGCESLLSLLGRTWGRYAAGNRDPWKSPVSQSQTRIALLKLPTVRVLITLGPVIRKLFTDLKQRKENGSHRLPQAEEHPYGRCSAGLDPTMLLRGGRRHRPPRWRG